MKRIPSFLATALLIAAGDASAASPPGNHGKSADLIPFEVLVKFKPGAQPTSIKTQIPGINVKTQSAHYSLLRLDDSGAMLYRPGEARAATMRMVEQLRRRGDVVYAQPNYRFEFSFVPTDPLYAQQWHYPPILLPAAWDYTRGSAAIRIAILDSGRTAHPDLAGRWSPLEFDAVAPGTPATDDGAWRHGTHVAGIAGAAVNNGNGGAGVCSGCQLLNVKIGDSTTGISMASVVNSIHWAVDNGARVINMSFESGMACTQANVPALRDAIDRAIYNSVSVVAAAGNNAVNVDNVTPASCPGVISVAASDRNNALAAYSSRGANIGVTAPGGGGVHTDPFSAYGQGIGCPADANSFFYPFTEGALSAWTTSPASGNAHCHRFLSGTSMAAPHVAGTVGLMLSMNPGLRPDQIRTVVRNTATALPNCNGNCGPGLLNARNAVLTGYYTPTGPCYANPAGPSATCVIDAISQYRNSGGALTETVIAFGKMWQFNASGARIGVTRDLRGIPRYATGPCAYAPTGQDCKIDSLTVIDYPGIGYVESISAYGRGWNYDINGSPWPGNGFLLSSISRYAAGPCAYAASSTTCRFATRTLVYAPEWGLDGLFESITAYGRYWIFDGAGRMIESNSLLNVARYASGPCAYRPAGSTCAFDSLDLQRVPGAGIYETITAYGRYFEWDGNGNPTSNHGQLLTNIARMR
ncbi:MAG: hypothetical protein E6Q88_08655 [Lysobacteraceae bacterium]|nr:MAG: hypothetical protein E6Q88_08655 [Xanthomonadaceae bacterium]